MNPVPVLTSFSFSVGSAVRNFSPFWFSTEPSDTLAVRGAPALLNCSVHGETPAKIEWRKDGSFLNLASDERRQILADGSLLITSVVHSKHNKPDEGVYQCVATIDTLGTIISHTARLSVAGKTRRFVRTVWIVLFIFFLQENNHLTFFCQPQKAKEVFGHKKQVEQNINYIEYIDFSNVIQVSKY